MTDCMTESLLLHLEITAHDPVKEMYWGGTGYTLKKSVKTRLGSPPHGICKFQRDIGKPTNTWRKTKKKEMRQRGRVWEHAVEDTRKELERLQKKGVIGMKWLKAYAQYGTVR